MEPLYLVVGIVLLIAGFVDILWTTLWVDGGSGPLSGRLTTGVWHALRTVTGEHNKALSLAGPLILTLTLAMWIGVIWIGWTFVFASYPLALVNTHTGGTADWAGRFYYVAYTMFTDGNGDYTPVYGGDVWEIASALTTATGMAFVTLGVSYVLTVLGAVSDKRSFASTVTGLGHRSEALVRTSWDGEDFQGLDLTLETLASDLSTLAEQHKAYPILHYYHSEKDDRASAVAVPIFDDALAIFEYGIPDDRSLDPAIIENGRSSARSYVETLDTAFIDPAEEVPPSPDLDRLREDDIPTVSDEAFADELEELTEHRRHLLGVVRADAWEWPPVEE
ncbi:two pore domain potassium channel family protein [Haloterrigena sp. SYSU A558-1]|uniref:Two pore domain potassium channel family protein n=1 Tax=Haloterrigena gelatinilytica TaxID=2741724 RepID=A0A8J8GNP8_9EURY|nr:two pore domain potassium channel family protein [Haloterrigena gelatinilytica]NUB92553.1 two pore domain potassium channel family protein [Haloterrigena gelatinilytica]NUC71530.1 two pore domain potassium channel family protein [Haloterrigena gelatinilytica]